MWIHGHLLKQVSILEGALRQRGNVRCAGNVLPTFSENRLATGLNQFLCASHRQGWVRVNGPFNPADLFSKILGVEAGGCFLEVA